MPQKKKIKRRYLKKPYRNLFCIKYYVLSIIYTSKVMFYNCMFIQFKVYKNFFLEKLNTLT